MTYNILIVDDTYEKSGVIAALLKDLNGSKFSLCHSAKEAIIKCRNELIDLLIVDLQIPNEIGDIISSSGGKDLIEYLRLSDGVYKPTHIIGITSHQDSYDSCLDYFNANGWPLLLGVQDKEHLRNLVETKIRHCPQKPVKVDVAIITALQRVELEAVLALPLNWESKRFPNDSNIYHIGTLTTKSGHNKTVVATSCSRMGMSAAAATTMKTCNLFCPELAIMTGIAAGVEGKTNFGDVLVADPCWDWGSGKLTSKDGGANFLTAPHQISLSTELRTCFQNISTNRLYLDEIYNKWGSSIKPSTSLNLHIGPIATGAVVLEDPKTVSSIVSQHRETIGVEMEAYGFSYAVSIANGKPVKSIVLKSVCDFANEEKNDNWQNYAAYTSAQLAFQFLVNEYWNQ